MAFKTFKELEKAINNKAQNSMRNNVIPYVEDTIQDAIEVEVYDAYTPTRYDRTGALWKLSNIIPTYVGTLEGYSTMQVNVEHEMSNGISKLVMMGQEMARSAGGVPLYDDAFIAKTKARYEKNGKTDRKAFWEPRNFMLSAKNTIHMENRIPELLKRGM